MKKILGNSCAKGCLVYGVVLLAIVAVTAFGLGGLKSKFGASSQGSQAAPNTQGTQGSQGTQINTQKSGPIAPLFVMASPQPVATPQQTTVTANSPGTSGNTNQAGAGANRAAPTQEAAQPVPPTLPKGAPAGSAPAVNSQAATSADAQGGTVSGEASAPFYVVQAGDTLWSISQRFRIDVDALRSVNNMADNTIYPGEAVSLPQETSSQQGAAQQPQQPTGGNANQGASQNAGQGTTNAPAVNNAGSAGATNDTTTGLPNMPDTGINKKP